MSATSLIKALLRRSVWICLIVVSPVLCCMAHVLKLEVLGYQLDIPLVIRESLLLNCGKTSLLLVDL